MIKDERLQRVSVVSVDTLLYFNRIVIALLKKTSLFFKGIFEGTLVKCLYGFNGGGREGKLCRVGHGINALSEDGKEKGKKEEKNKERNGFLAPEKTPKDDSRDDKNDSHGQKDGTSPHPGDQIESRGKGSKDGAEGGKGINLSNHIARLLKIGQGQFDYDRGDHPKETGRDKKDEGGDQQDPCHQTRVKLGPANQIGQ